MIAEPLAIYRLTPDQAIAFGQELIQAAEAAQRIRGERPYPEVKWRVESDTPDAIIHRRIED